VDILRIFFDFEFIENGDAFVMKPISIGMVREDGEKFYREFEGVDWSKANQWVIQNVRPKLRSFNNLDNSALVNKKDAAKQIKEFVGEKPEFWAYFADYDWVLLCQLYGPMINLPEGWPKYCLDLKQYMYHMGVDKDYLYSWGIINEEAHGALADAEWNRKAFDFINQNCWEFKKP
jgi:hypothetical protein